MTSGELAESPGDTGVSEPISKSEVVSDAGQSGSGKVAGEGRKEETGSQMSKDDEVDQFAQRKTRTSSSEDTETRPNRTGERRAHSVVALLLHLGVSVSS